MPKTDKPKRHMGWKVTGRKLTKDPTGVTMERVERVRTAGVLKKLSSAFFDELDKIAARRFFVGPGGPKATYVTNVVKSAPKPMAKPPQFKASKEWQEVPKGTALPPGLNIKMDMRSGKNYARA